MTPLLSGSEAMTKPTPAEVRKRIKAARPAVRASLRKVLRKPKADVVARQELVFAQLKALFDQNCPDVPICRERVEQIFAHGAPDLSAIATLAHDLGLPISCELVKRNP